VSRFIFILSGVVFSVSLIFGFLAWQNDEPQRMPAPTAVQFFEGLLDAARSGDAAAQRQVAEAYLTGKGTIADPVQAAKWMARASEQGDVVAQYRLARLYEEGRGLRADYRRAAALYEQAATRGNLADAQYALGDLHYDGRGTVNDYAEALRWYRMAAENGQPVAQYRLGTMYAEGWGVDKDPVAAYAWYSRAMAGAAQIRAFNPDYDPAAARRRLVAEMNRHQVEQAERRLAGSPGR